MSSPRFLVLQPKPDQQTRLHDWLTEPRDEQAAALLDTRPAFGDELPTELDGYQALIVLGAEGEVPADNPADGAAALAPLRALLSTAVSTSTPTLAINLGAQQLAVATGGRIRSADRGPELGPRLVAKRDSATRDPLFGDLPLTPDVLQFHEQEIEPLPPTAELLASAPRCANQAFRVGRYAYGLQFHIETTTSQYLAWFAERPDLAERIRPAALDADHLDEVHEAIAETWRPFVQRFADLATGGLEGSTTPRELPLV
ncbi:type 1 glutamine amidotransferase [Tamaricihabitans halophyticus]|uniref:type 1 glutamine amidotransferase n=1 Tax=Tamaricihabitans halophyticus TaxID=1262583 RepID=UPI001FB43343|nr:type 1 glutamine amidotransferase [Tamaricihabitans halophyticus]